MNYEHYELGFPPSVYSLHSFLVRDDLTQKKYHQVSADDVDSFSQEKRRSKKHTERFN